MLTKISIEGFKSIHKIESLELGQINVFIGANGSGKSNLLEAVGVLGTAVSGRVDSESLRRRGVRLSPNELYKTNLEKKNSPQWITFKVEGKWNGSIVEYEVSLNNTSDESDVWVYGVKTVRLNGQLIMENPSAGLVDDPVKLNTFLREYAIFTPTTPVLRGIQPDILSVDPLGLLGGRLAEAVEDILDLRKNQIGRLDLDEVLDLLDWVNGFDIKPPSRDLLSPDVPSLRSVVEFRDRWMGMKRNRISGYDASEGALYVLFMLVLALHPRTPRFFAVDNFDQTLNPRLVRALTRLFCRLIVEDSSPHQALLTTHNPLVLDGLNLRDERIRLFAIERNYQTGGATRVSRVELSEKVLQTAENGTPLSQMWVMGLLGGVPDLF